MLYTSETEQSGLLLVQRLKGVVTGALGRLQKLFEVTCFPTLESIRLFEVCMLLTYQPTQPTQTLPPYFPFSSKPLRLKKPPARLAGYKELQYRRLLSEGRRAVEAKLLPGLGALKTPLGRLGLSKNIEAKSKVDLNCSIKAKQQQTKSKPNTKTNKP